MEFLRFLVLGLGIGGTYALGAQGLVLIYRGSGVINLAQGTLVGVGAYTYFEMTATLGWPAVPSLLVAMLAGAAVGALVHAAVMHPLRTASALMRLIATTGVMTVLGQVLQLRYGDVLRVLPPLFPTGTVTFTRALTIAQDRLWILGVAVVLTVALATFYRRHRLGIATTALAESERVVASHGWPPARLALLNWTVGCALAALAGGLLGPVVQLTPTSTTLLVVPFLAAAVIGGFRSFPLTLAGGLLIGAGQSLLTQYVPVAGVPDALPFLVVIVVLVVRGRALPLRSHVVERLPRIGLPRWRARVTGPVAVAALAGTLLLPDTWADAVAVTAATAVVGLSVVVVVGYAGQLSLAQFALAGVGALAASRLVAVWGVSFWVGLVAAIAVAVPVGLVAGIPSLRTRGVNLAIATLGLAVALDALVFTNSDVTGGILGTVVGPPELFGIDLDPILYPARYAALCVAGFVLAAVVVRNVRLGPGGRRLLAVRANERAAAALGIGVVRTKLYGFVIGSVLAALGGVLIAFHTPNVLFAPFGTLAGIQIVVLVVIGGVGFVMGSPQGSLLATGAAGALLIDTLLDLGRWVPLIGGVILLVTIIANPDGIVPKAQQDMGRLLRRRRRPAPPPVPATGRISVPPRTLELRGVDVRIGSIHPVADVSFTVEPGTVVGLIGPNGAGKTTCIDAVSGFVGATGSVRLDGTPLDRLSASVRARRGLGRSFQSLELFEDETVWENLASASDAARPPRHGLDLLFPRPPVLSDAAALAVELFGLRPHLATPASELPTGTRRLLAIARAVAAAPSVLLLDEPAAGLDEHESDELGALLRTLSREWGVGVLLVEHDMRLVMGVCDRVVVMDAGRIIADGPADRVAVDPAVVAAYLGASGPVADVVVGATTSAYDPEARRGEVGLP